MPAWKNKFNIFATYLLMLTALCCIFCTKARAEEEEKSSIFRVGMEAAYAPFNWTQNDNKNDAIIIDGEEQYANGYDVQVAKIIAENLGKKLVIVKMDFMALVPALTSKKIDAIIGGMNPSEERRKEIAFTSESYYESDFVLVVNASGKFKNAKTIKDFKGAKISAQQGTAHYKLIDQIPQCTKQEAMKDFSQMRQALKSNIIDAYVAEKPEGIGAETADKSYKMITFQHSDGFIASAEEKSICVGMRKNDKDIIRVNEIVANFSKEKQSSLMEKMIKIQPLESVASSASDSSENFLYQTFKIARDSGLQFIKGAGTTLFIALFGTIAGLVIGLAIGVYRTKPISSNKSTRVFDRIFTCILSVYIEIFRGTPMIVQAMVIYYGSAQAFGLNINKMMAALFIVSVNTGAYMSEIVRGGIYAVDKGQFEAASAIGMTHKQAMARIVIPQVLRNILPATGNEFVINIKDTSVLNVISVVELYFSGNTVATQNYQYFQTFTIIAVIYFVMTFAVTRILRLLERTIDKEKKVRISTYANQMQTKDASDEDFTLLQGGAK